MVEIKRIWVLYLILIILVLPLAFKRSINTTGNRSYLVLKKKLNNNKPLVRKNKENNNYSYNYILVDTSTNSVDEIRIITFPRNDFASGNCLSTFSIDFSCENTSLAGTRIKNTPKWSDERNCFFKKSESLVSNIRSSFTDNEKTRPFLMVLGDNLTSCPCFFNRGRSSWWTFSSNKNFILSRNFSKPFVGKTHSQIHGCLDMVPSESRVSSHDFFNTSSSLKHFKYSVHHHPCPFKCWLSMANFTIRNNIFVNFDSHIDNKANEVYKDYVDEWVKDQDLVNYVDIEEYKIPQ